MSDKEPISNFKVANLVCGAISLMIGLYSHFQSLWVKPVEDALYLVPLYAACDYIPADRNEDSCPSIALEQFYVSVIIICFVLSLVTFLLGLGINLHEQPYRKVDCAYHIISSIALVVGGALYILSAVQIYALFDLGNAKEKYRFRTYEKFASGAIALLQGILYAITGNSLRG